MSISRRNQSIDLQSKLTGFYVRGTLTVKGLNKLLDENILRKFSNTPSQKYYGQITKATNVTV